jgi:4-amino-4-deoxy-L-arabinose transferase-like glycosyltransferase
LSHLSQFTERMNDPKCLVRLTCGVAAIALAMRLIVLLAFWPSWVWQSGHVQDDWNKLAINLVTSGTFGFAADEPTVQRGPIFPLLEIPLYLLFDERYGAWSTALLLFDACTSVLLVVLGRKLWGNRAALLAGLFHAVHLPVIYYSANIEQFTTVLPLVLLWFYLISAWDLRLSNKYQFVALGLVSGILILSKTVYLPVVIGSAAALISFNWKRHDAKALAKQLALMLLVAGLVVVPWTYRNYVVTDGKFIPVQSLFWDAIWQKFVNSDLDAREGWNRPSGRMLEFMLARQEQLFRSPGNPNTSQLTGPQRELYYETTYKGQVLEWIKADPASYVRNIVSNMWYFWVGAENMKKTLLMAAMQVPLLSAAVLGLWLAIQHRQIHKLRFGLVLIFILWGEYSLVFGWGRYSLDAVPVLALIFGTGIDARLRHREHVMSHGARYPARMLRST